jgi:hypothetical protein
MFSNPTSPTRRGVLASTAAAGAFGLAASASTTVFGDAQGEGKAREDAIRPFRVDVPEAEPTDLRRRLAATRWPDRETVTDDSQGVPLATRLGRRFDSILKAT